MKRSVAESIPDRASVHTRNAAFEAVSAPEQYCSAPLLKVERSVSDRFLKRSESSLNTLIGAEIATEPRFGKLSLTLYRSNFCNGAKTYPVQCEHSLNILAIYLSANFVIALCSRVAILPRDDNAIISENCIGIASEKLLV